MTGTEPLVDRLLDRTLVGYTRLGPAVRRRLPGWPDDPPAGALAGKHVAITGASSGLGEACARQAHALGAHAPRACGSGVRSRSKPRSSAFQCAGSPRSSEISPSAADGCVFAYSACTHAPVRMRAAGPAPASRGAGLARLRWRPDRVCGQRSRQGSP